MKKIFLTSLTTLGILSAGIINGVSVIVNNTPITLYEIEELSTQKSISQNDAMNLLVRKKLEESEAKQRKIEISDAELQNEISTLARRNRMSVMEFTEALRNSRGMNSKQLKEQLNRQLLQKKLYSSITYSKMKMPDDNEISDYYRINKNDFSIASSYDVVQYRAKDPKILQSVANNPLMNPQGVSRQNMTLKTQGLSPDFVKLLHNTKEQSFSSIVPDKDAGYALYYVQSKNDLQLAPIEKVKNSIINSIMEEKRERTLKNYFQKLRVTADIKILREPR